MVLTYLPVTLVPVAVSIATTAVIVYAVVICVCGKRSTKGEPELTDVKVQRNSAVQPPAGLGPKGSTDPNDVTDPGAVHLEPDTAITPLEQGPKQNGTLHSRGNSADLTKSDRHSGTSSGSSPRQATLSRELPDIPIQSRDKGNHSHLPEVPSGARQSNFKPESAARGGHSHSQLPDIPKSRISAADSNLRGGSLPNVPVSQQNTSPTIPRSNVESKPVVRLSMEVPVPVPQSSSKTDLDDYDHINESKRKKSRPRSDYDHVLIEGDQKRIIPARQIEDPDYAEVRNENIYEGVTDDVTVVPVKPTINVTQTKTKSSIIVVKAPVKESCVDDPDPPYNRIKEESSNIKGSRDPPYNRIKDDPSYSGIKDITDPYNTVKDEDPYNKVKGEEDSLIVRLSMEVPVLSNSLIDDADPYNTVIDTDSETPRRKFPLVKAKVDGPNYDPYALVDDERNVSNQSGSTDPYSRVCDTEIDDPYNRVIDDDDNDVGAKSGKRSDIKDEDKGYSTVNKIRRVEYATVNKVSIRRKKEDTSNFENRTERQQKSSGQYARDEYSTVMKVRQGKNVNDINTEVAGTCPDEYSTVMKVSQDKNVNDTNTEVAGTSQVDRTVAPRFSQPPEEPPRDYDDDDDDSVADDFYDNNADADHYNTVLQVSAGRGTAAVSQGTGAVTTATVITTTTSTTTTTTTTTVAVIAAGAADGTSSGPGVKKKEPPYTKLSARESLASMNARMASNTYETVSEVDNLYATVEGGSGDGVVRPESTRQSVSGRSSVSELYAEIPESVSAPAPPSLVSLHETAKQQSNQRTPSGQGHSRTPSGQGHFRTPSGDNNSGSIEGRVTLATEEVVDLDHANFKTDVATPDDLEYDPNYETVEEAKSRVKYEEINGTSKTETKIRAHVYEEVTVTNEARRTRQRVLNLHTYEDITGSKYPADDTNRRSTNSDLEQMKTMDEKMSNEVGATGGESKSKKSKSDTEKMKDKVKGRKKSESKEKSEKSGKSGKK